MRNEFRSSSAPVSRGHVDDEGEEVIDERVERLVGERANVQMRDRLELVIDEQLRQHEHEPERIHAVGRRMHDP